MGVGLKTQAEVGGGVRLVDSQLHALEHEKIHIALDVLPRRRVDDRLEPDSVHQLIDRRSRKPQPRERPPDTLDGLLVRAGMGPENGGAHLIRQPLGHSAVGRQHALFDQAVRLVPGGAGDRGWVSFLVDLDNRLGEIEIETPLRHPAGAKLPGQGGKFFERGAMRQRAFVLLPLGDFGALQNRSGAGIGKRNPGADPRQGQTKAHPAALGVKIEGRREGPPHHPFSEGANIARKEGREHGQRAIREVDAVSAPGGFLIDLRTRADIVAHVGDMNAEAAASARQGFDGYRIVAIPRGARVDGEGLEIAQIRHPAGEGLILRGRPEPFGLFQNLGRKGIAQNPLRDDHLLFDRRVVRIAERTDDFAARLLPGARVAFDLGFDPLPVSRAPPLRGGDENVVADALVLRLDPGPPPVGDETANKGFVRALDDIDNITLAAAVSPGTLHPDGHPVPVHGPPCAPPLDENIGPALRASLLAIDSDKAVAIPVAPEFSPVDEKALWESVARAHAHENTIGRESAHPLAEGGPRIGGHAQRADHLAHGHRSVLFGEKAENCAVRGFGFVAHFTNTMRRGLWRITPPDRSSESDRC